MKSYTRLILASFVASVMISCGKDDTGLDTDSGGGANSGGNEGGEQKTELSLSDTEILVGSASTTKTVKLTANADWSIESCFESGEWAWCTISPLQGSAGVTTLTVNIQNNGYDQREHIFVIKSGEEDILLRIEQGPVVQFGISGSKKKAVFYDEGGQLELEGFSSVGYQIVYLEGADTWISAEVHTKAFEFLNFRFQIAPYDGVESRTGQIVIRAPREELSDTITIIQYHDQEIDIPDVYFRKYCLTRFDNNDDGKITKRETEGVSEIRVSGLQIKSMIGVEEFADLWLLDCDDNQITELDISENAELYSLNCDGNALTKLDVRRNKKLMHLSCDNNRISELSFSKHRWITFSCSHNELSSLGNEPIETEVLSCSYNRIEYLNLNTSFSEGIVLIYCSNNLLSELDMSRCGNCYSLDCSNNQLTTLELTHCKVLTNLDCSNNQLQQITISENNQLKHVDAANNKLRSIHLHQALWLERLDLTDNQLETLDGSGCILLEGLSVANNDLQQLYLNECKNLTYLTCYNNRLVSLDVSETNLNNRDSYYALDCAPMSTLETLCLKNGWKIKGINNPRDEKYIPENTQILYK